MRMEDNGYMLRKILSLGKYSGVVSLPKEFMKKVGLRRGQMVEVEVEKKKVLIKDAK